MVMFLIHQAMPNWDSWYCQQTFLRKWKLKKAHRLNLERSKKHFTTAVDYSETAQEKKQYYSKYIFTAEAGNMFSSNISNSTHQTLRPDMSEHKVNINCYKEGRGCASWPCTAGGVLEQAATGKFQPVMIIHSGSPERHEGQVHISKSLTWSCCLAKHAERRKANILINARNDHSL